MHGSFSTKFITNLTTSCIQSFYCHGLYMNVTYNPHSHPIWWKYGQIYGFHPSFNMSHVIQAQLCKFKTIIYMHAYFDFQFNINNSLPLQSLLLVINPPWIHKITHWAHWFTYLEAQFFQSKANSRVIFQNLQALRPKPQSPTLSLSMAGPLLFPLCLWSTKID